MRNALAYLPKAQTSTVGAALRQAFIQPDRKAASQTLRPVADQLRPKFAKLAVFVEASQTDVLSYMDFPAQHRSKIHSTNPIERLNKEVKRRADMVGIFPNEASIIRLIGAVLLEQNDEWQLQHRYMQVLTRLRVSFPNPSANLAISLGSVVRQYAAAMRLAPISMAHGSAFSLPVRGCHQWPGIASPALGGK